MIDTISTVWNWITEHATVLSAVVSAIAAVVVAWFTVRLTGATRGQLANLQVQLTLARNEFESTHRPKITVRGFQTLSNRPKNNEIVVQFVFVNVGDLPAKVTEIRHSITISGDLPSGIIFKSHKFDTPVWLVSGDKESFPIDDQDHGNVLANRWDAYRAVFKTQEIPPAYVTGVVIYEDSTGRRRETGFCRVTHWLTADRWEKLKASEYDYED